MIPTIILLGLLLGRWWLAALAVAAVAWPAAMVVDGSLGLEPGGWLAAGLLAILNATVGVAVHQAGLWLARRVQGPAVASTGQGRLHRS